MAKMTLISAVVSMAVGTAASAKPMCPGMAHTVHTITVNQNATCVLAKLYEATSFCLVGKNGNEVKGPIEMTPGQPFYFGMSFTDMADFNLQYALTCVRKDGKNAQSPKVIFNIGANGAAQPSIETINLYNATGTWESTGQGENYFVKFPQ